MSDLEKYEAVNKCETFEEFEKVLLSFADETRLIKGRTNNFNVDHMLQGAKDYYNNALYGTPRSVTREYGLRQQLMYLKYYK